MVVAVYSGWADAPAGPGPSPHSVDTDVVSAGKGRLFYAGCAATGGEAYYPVDKMVDPG